MRSRVLVAESEPALRQALVDQFRAIGIFPDLVSNAASAIAALSLQPHSMVLLDLGMAGIETVLNAIHPLDEDERPLVIGIATAEIARVADSELVQMLVRRPVSVADLTAMVSACLQSIERPRVQPPVDGEACVA